MEQSWPVSSQPVSVEEQWKWHRHHLGSVFQKRLNTVSVWALTTSAGLLRWWTREVGFLTSEIQHMSSESVGFWERTGSASVITWNLANEMFPGNPALMATSLSSTNTRPVSRLDYNQLFQQQRKKKVTFQCKDNNSSIVCFFSRHSITFLLWPKWLHIEKTKQLMSNSSTDIYKE